MHQNGIKWIRNPWKTSVAFKLFDRMVSAESQDTGLTNPAMVTPGHSDSNKPRQSSTINDLQEKTSQTWKPRITKNCILADLYHLHPTSIHIPSKIKFQPYPQVQSTSQLVSVPIRFVDETMFAPPPLARKLHLLGDVGILGENDNSAAAMAPPAVSP